MIQVVIQLDPDTGVLRLQGPRNKMEMLYALEVAKRAVMAPPAPADAPPIEVPDAGLARRLLEGGGSGHGQQ